jgi:hypothetical protein
MSVDHTTSITKYNNEQYRLMSVQHVDQQHAEKVQQERKAKINHEITEAERVAQNRRMNRAGQNIDKFA